MSEYFFGLGPGHLSSKVERAAEEAGGTLVNYTEPSGERRHWFACPNMGAPFDQDRAERVLTAAWRAATPRDAEILEAQGCKDRR